MKFPQANIPQGWHRGSGIVRYDPARGDMKSRTQWWCVIDVDPEIARYYRWWVNTMGNPLGIERDNLCLPAWGAHISIVRGERPRDDLAHLWRKYQGARVEFAYQHAPRQSGDTTGDRPNWYWFVDVQCDLGKQIRQELCKPSHWNFHLTVGRSYDR